MSPTSASADVRPEHMRGESNADESGGVRVDCDNRRVYTDTLSEVQRRPARRRILSHPTFNAAPIVLNREAPAKAPHTKANFSVCLVRPDVLAGSSTLRCAHL